MYYYFIDAGSNIDPDENVISIIEELIKEFNEIHISRIVKTKPVNVGGGDFLNFSICLRSGHDAVKIKKILNMIEIKLGRDRTNRDKKHMSRTADLDILFKKDDKDKAINPDDIPDESYIKMPLIELINWLEFNCELNKEDMPDGVELHLDKIPIGSKPLTLSIQMIK